MWFIYDTAPILEGMEGATGGMRGGGGRCLTCGQVGGAHVRSAAAGGGGEHWFLQMANKHTHTHTQITH